MTEHSQDMPLRAELASRYMEAMLSGGMAPTDPTEAVRRSYELADALLKSAYNAMREATQRATKDDGSPGG
jgi:hypothetical protein